MIRHLQNRHCVPVTSPCKWSTRTKEMQLFWVWEQAVCILILVISGCTCSDLQVKTIDCKCHSQRVICLEVFHEPCLHSSLYWSWMVYVVKDAAAIWSQKWITKWTTHVESNKDCNPSSLAGSRSMAEAPRWSEKHMASSQPLTLCISAMWKTTQQRQTQQAQRTSEQGS